VSDGFHPPIEEYLEAICELEEENIPVIQARLAERLEHTAASVSEMIHRLRDEGFITISGRAIALTAQGRERISHHWDQLERLRNLPRNALPPEG